MTEKMDISKSQIIRKNKILIFNELAKKLFDLGDFEQAEKVKVCAQSLEEIYDFYEKHNFEEESKKNREYVIKVATFIRENIRIKDDVLAQPFNV